MVLYVHIYVRYVEESNEVFINSKSYVSYHAHHSSLRIRYYDTGSFSINPPLPFLSSALNSIEDKIPSLVPQREIPDQWKLPVKKEGEKDVISCRGTTVCIRNYIRIIHMYDKYVRSM